MGYYSNFSLGVYHADAGAIIADLREHNEYAHKAMDEAGCTQDSTKWYEMDEDMKEFSKKYPEVLFEMTRQGESGGEDQCIYYFKNGKKQECWAIITFPDFDHDKLE